MTQETETRSAIFSKPERVTDRDTSDICLNMIVKNETRVLERLFLSVAPFINYFVIVDTGSTDGTPEFIIELAARHGLPGEVHFRNWVNFGHNRQQALELAVNAAKGRWLLFIDADEELKYSDPLWFENLKPGVTYNLAKHHGSMRNFVPHLLDISQNQWQWRGPAHNYISHQGGPGRRMNLDTVWIQYHSGQGAKSHGVTPREKYLRDAALFEVELKNNPNDARSRFYLAQSYRDAGELEKALQHYALRADMGGWKEEIFYSLYMIAGLKERLNHSADEVLTAYAAATAAQPMRAEAVRAAARFCRMNKFYKRGYEFAKPALNLKFFNGVLFGEPWVYHYGLLDEYAVCAYWIGRYNECLEACHKILELSDIDFNMRQRVEKNANYAREKLGLATV